MGHFVALMSDMLVVVYLSKQGGTMFHALCMLTQQIFTWTELHSIVLVVRFVSNRKESNGRPAEDQTIGTEWSVHPWVINIICPEWDRPVVD